MQLCCFDQISRHIWLGGVHPGEAVWISGLVSGLDHFRVLVIRLSPFSHIPHPPHTHIHYHTRAHAHTHTHPHTPPHANTQVLVASIITGLRWTTAQLTLQKEELGEC